MKHEIELLFHSDAINTLKRAPGSILRCKQIIIFAGTISVNKTKFIQLKHSGNEDFERL